MAKFWQESGLETYPKSQTILQQLDVSTLGWAVSKLPTTLRNCSQKQLWTCSSSRYEDDD